MLDRSFPATRIGRRGWLNLSLVLLIVIGVILAGVLAYHTGRAMVLASANPQQSGPQIVKEAQSPTAIASGTPLPSADLSAGNPNLPASAPQLTPWDGVGRVTVLLLGLDYRDWSSGEKYWRSDTMILLTLDPLNKTAGILSIPRDMWVAIPGFQHAKINTAYYLGDAYKLPGGGPGLAVKTVEQFLGIPINYYAQIDFDAFVKFIDAIGGVKIDVPDKITVDLLGAGSATKKTLQPGVQVLPGEWALAYARARYTQGGDFDRARRQQQVILGVRDRVLSLNMLPTLIQKAPEMYQQLASGVHTNLTLDDVVKLALLAQQVPEANIKHGVFSEKDTIFGWSPDKLSILIPIPDRIHLLRDQIFATSGSLAPQTPGSPAEQMRAEGASLAIYNGSGTAGLAQRTAEYLGSQGAKVAYTGDAEQAYTVTTLVAHRGSPYLMKYLVDMMGIKTGKIQFDDDQNAAYDVELYLGMDWAQSNSLP